MLMFAAHFLGAVLGDSGPTADVWVTRVTLLSGIVVPQIILIIKVIQGRDEVKNGAAALTKRMDKAEELLEEHHQANQASIAAIAAKVDAAFSKPSP